MIVKENGQYTRTWIGGLRFLDVCILSWGSVEVLNLLSAQNNYLLTAPWDLVRVPDVLYLETHYVNCSWLTLINLLLHVRLVASSGWMGPNGTTLIGCQGSPITQQIRRTAWKFCLITVYDSAYSKMFILVHLSTICVHSFLFLAFFLASETHRYPVLQSWKKPKIHK